MYVHVHVHVNVYMYKNDICYNYASIILFVLDKVLMKGTVIIGDQRMEVV